MTSCDHYRGLLLDHLYGLLDPTEAVAVETHLAGCPACQSARAEADRTGQLFARAAKHTFPHVRFTPPSPAGTETVPSSPPTGSGRSRRSAGVSWAVAAGVLVFLTGALIPLQMRTARYEAARQEIENAAPAFAAAQSACETTRNDAEAKVRNARDAFVAARTRAGAVLAEWVAAEKAADRNANSVAVTKPAAVQPGAPNEFIIALGDVGANRRVEAEIRDRTGAVVYRQPLAVKAGGGQYPVRLPVGVWAKLKPQAELFLAVAAVDEQTRERTNILDSVRLFGPVFATLLVTDKASYRPGERVYFRSLTLDRVTFRPPDQEQRLHFSLRKADGTAVPGVTLMGTTDLVRVDNGRLAPVIGPDGHPVRGVGCGAFALPPTLPDGDYQLTLTEYPGRGGSTPAIAAPVTRTIKVRSGKVERFRKQIGFAAASFAPGQAVEAWAELKLGDKPIAGAAVKVAVTADDTVVSLVRITPQTAGPDGKPHPTTDARGRVQIRFPLPAVLPRGDVKLLVTFQTPEAEESVAERVPVTGKDVLVEFFPEGGKLVAGVPNRVYVRGTTPAGRPVDVRGTITAGNETVTRIESPADADEPGVNRGLDSFTFTPKAGTAYYFTLRTPGASTNAAFELPRVEADGVTMSVPDAVTGPGQPIRVRLHSVGRARTLIAGAYLRGRLADTKRVAVEPGQAAEVELQPADETRGGVVRLTVFEEPVDARADLLPVAERLVFRKPGAVLNLAVNARPADRPGEPVNLSVMATDEAGRPVPAILWAAVVNTAVAPGAKDRSLPTHFLLAGEVQTPDDLEYADFLLTDHPRAAAALDRVLATQGWRRFVEQAAVAERKPPAVERLLAFNGQYPLTTETAADREHRTLFGEYQPRYEEAINALEATRTAQAFARQQEADLQAASAPYRERHEVMLARSAAARKVSETAASLRSVVCGGAVLVLAAGIGCLVFARRFTRPALLAASGAAVVLLILSLGAKREPLAEIAPLAEWVPVEVPNASEPEPVPSFTADASEPFVFQPAGPIPKVEPGVTASVGGTATRPRIPAPPTGTTPTLDAKLLIPADLLKRAVAERTAAQASVHPSAFAALREADRQEREPAIAAAARRAAAFVGPLAAVLPPPKPGEADARSRLWAAVPVLPSLVVREYAAPRPGSADTPLSADSDTLLWQPVLVLPTEGKATLSFSLEAAPGGYQVLVAGHTQDGRLGSVRTIVPPDTGIKTVPPAPK